MNLVNSLRLPARGGSKTSGCAPRLARGWQQPSGRRYSSPGHRLPTQQLRRAPRLPPHPAPLPAPLAPPLARPWGPPGLRDRRGRPGLRDHRVGDDRSAPTLPRRGWTPRPPVAGLVGSRLDRSRVPRRLDWVFLGWRAW